MMARIRMPQNVSNGGTKIPNILSRNGHVFFVRPNIAPPSVPRCGITNLDNPLLTQILMEIPLMERIVLRRVSPKWCALIDQLCAKMKQLKLFGIEEQYQDYDVDLQLYELEECKELHGGKDESLVSFSLVLKDE